MLSFPLNEIKIKRFCRGFLKFISEFGKLFDLGYYFWLPINFFLNLKQSIESVFTDILVTDLSLSTLCL